MELIAAMAGITNAINLVKTMRQIEKDYDASTLKIQLADLSNALADAKMTLTEISLENYSLKNENERLKKSQSETQNLVEYDGFLFLKKEDGSLPKFPICPCCYEKEKYFTQLVPDGYAAKGKCPRCSENFEPIPSVTETGQFVERRPTSSVEIFRVRNHYDHF